MKIALITVSSILAILVATLSILVPVAMQNNVSVAIINNSAVSITLVNPSFLSPPGLNFYYLNTPTKIIAYNNVQAFLNSTFFKSLQKLKQADDVLSVLGSPKLMESKMFKQMLNLDADNFIQQEIDTDVLLSRLK
jgi:hypothetical protein